MPTSTLPYELSLLIFISIWALLFLLALFLISRSRGIPIFEFKRHEGNPLIKPTHLSHWETEAIFNPAAFIDDEEAVHLLYRAIGSSGLSQIGYAKSDDGKIFASRSPYPVYQPDRPITEEEANLNKPKEFNRDLYASGGGWGGCEDPRAVRIDDKVYMNYTAFEGWHSIRIALTSILLEDLKKGRWNWKKPRMLSPLGETHKNWVLFPEKVNGKYAILTGITPKIMIEYVDDLDNFKGVIKSNRPPGPQPGRMTHWDKRIRGAGAPPIKTELGWLLLYHAIDDKEPHKYKLGAMILSEKDPTEILYRSPLPLLSPEMFYENDGKPGVIYASGAVVKHGDLHIYYGGGDKYVCSASTSMRELLNWLKYYGKLRTA